MGGSKKQTVGYYYFLGVHMVLCHGPVDKVTRIRVDKKTAWTGDSSVANTGLFGAELPEGQIQIHKPSLFGGNRREGGISGFVDLELGKPDQGQNDYLVKRLGSTIPAFRGVVGAVLRQVYLGMNPYLKPWAFRLQRVYTRQDGLEQWYALTAGVLSTTDFAEFIDSWENDHPGFTLHKVGTQVRVPGSSDPPGEDQYTLAMAEQYDLDWETISDPPDVDALFHWRTNESGLIYSKRDEDEIDNGNMVRDVINRGLELNETFEARYWEFAGITMSTIVPAGSGAPDAPAGISWTAGSDNPLSTSLGSVDLYRSTYVYETIEITRTLDMNPAHLIRECLTDPDWGMGYAEDDVDDEAFRAAADALFDEETGMSILWDRQVPIEDFVLDVMRHIDAALYVDRTNGKFVLKLVRDDYDTQNLIKLGPSEIQEVDSYARPAPGELINAITVNYWDAETGNTASLTAHDTAMIHQQGVMIDATNNYPGFTNATIAARVAARDLRQLSNPLLSATIIVNSAAEDLNIGDVFLFDWPELHDTPIVMRITDMAFGNGRSHKIRISCTEDVFSIADNTVVIAPTEKWEDPNTDPEAAQHRLVTEAPYFELVQQLGQTAADDLLTNNPEAGYMLASAARPESAINAELRVDDGSGYEEGGIVEFSPAAFTTSTVTHGQTVIPIEDGSDLDLVETGTLCQMGEELCRVDAVSDSEVTLGRGILDTIPAEHAAGTLILFWDEYAEGDETEYAAAELIDVKLLPVTGFGVLAEASAPVDSVTFDQRAMRPYPPGNLQINGSAYPEAIGGSEELSLTWAHRDRLQQTSGEFEDTTEGNIGPESGVTYTLRIYGESGELGRTEVGISGTSYTYDAADEKEDFQLSGGGDALDFPTTLLQHSLFAYWRLDEESGTAAEDASDNENAGTYVNSPTLGRDPLIATGKSIEFSGSDNAHVDTGLKLGWGSGGLRTVVFWVNPDSNGEGGFGRIMSCESSTGWGIYVVSSSELRFRSESTGNSNNFASAKALIGETRFIGLVRDGSNLLLYVDGELEDAKSIVSVSDPSANILLGNNPALNRALDGRLDEVGFSDDVLSASQMKALFDAGPVAGGASFRLNGRLRIELESRRAADSTAEGDLVSYQHHDYTVLREGYGFNYGELYGGAE